MHVFWAWAVQGETRRPYLEDLLGGPEGVVLSCITPGLAGWLLRLSGLEPRTERAAAFVPSVLESDGVSAVVF